MTWNNFKGAARQLDDIDLPKIGYEIGVGEDEIHAVMDVEAAGDGFDSQGRPRILFERHHFWRQLGKGAKRDKAHKQGLAVSRWSRATYGKDQYALLKKAMKIDETAALKACSWGLGQIMGWNHKVAGYPSVQAMVRAFMMDEEYHLSAMVNFIKNAGLDDNLRNHDWRGFARGYNGSGYEKNKYHTKLENSYRKWSRIKDTAWSPEPNKKLIEVAQDAAATDRVPSTTVAASITGAGPIVGVGAKVAEQVSEAKSIFEVFVNAGPWLLLGLVCLGAAYYIYKERSRKSKMAKDALA